MYNKVRFLSHSERRDDHTVFGTYIANKQQQKFIFLFFASFIKTTIIINSDVRMPGKDGIELLGLIREDERLERVPVILLTAKALTQDRVLGYKVSCSKTKKSCAFVHHFQAVLCCYKPQKLCKH